MSRGSERTIKYIKIWSEEEEEEEEKEKEKEEYRSSFVAMLHVHYLHHGMKGNYTQTNQMSIVNTLQCDTHILWL
jgi:hypothetical protein